MLEVSISVYTVVVTEASTADNLTIDDLIDDINDVIDDVIPDQVLGAELLPENGVLAVDVTLSIEIDNGMSRAS